MIVADDEPGTIFPIWPAALRVNQRAALDPKVAVICVGSPLVALEEIWLVTVFDAGLKVPTWLVVGCVNQRLPSDPTASCVGLPFVPLESAGYSVIVTESKLRDSSASKKGRLRGRACLPAR
jgi:hypothetical protein